MKMTSTKADLGDDEGIASRHYLLSSSIRRHFPPCADKINPTELFFSFPVFSSKVILDSNQSKNVFTLFYVKRS